MTKLHMIFQEQVFHVVLKDHPLTQSIIAMCPFDATYTRGGNHEYYTTLPDKADVKNCPETVDGEKNKLYVFPEWNALSLVIRDCCVAPYRIYEVGQFEEDVASVLARYGNSVHIRCEIEKE